MKKTIIIILAMLFFIAIPAFASTPENENAPAPTSEDQMFLDLIQINEYQLISIVGNIITDPISGWSPNWKIISFQYTVDPLSGEIVLTVTITSGRVVPTNGKYTYIINTTTGTISSDFLDEIISQLPQK